MTSSLAAAGGRRGKRSLGLRAGRLALLFVAIVNLLGAAYRAFEAATVVRGDRVLEFTWRFFAYPAALAVLAVLAIWLLHRERPAGAALASFVLTVHGVRMLLGAVAGDGDYPSATSRLTGQLFMGAVGAFFLWCAGALGFEARSLHQGQATTTVST